MEMHDSDNESVHSDSSHMSIQSQISRSSVHSQKLQQTETSQDADTTKHQLSLIDRQVNASSLSSPMSFEDVNLPTNTFEERLESPRTENHLSDSEQSSQPHQSSSPNTNFPSMGTGDEELVEEVFGASDSEESLSPLKKNSGRKSLSRSRSPSITRSENRSLSRSPFSEKSASQSRFRSKSKSHSRSRSGSVGSGGKSRSNSRSRSRSSSRSRSRSKSGSRPRSRSRSGSRSRSRSRSGSRSRSRSKSGSGSRSRSKSGSRSRSRSKSGSRSRSRSKSGSRSRSRSKSGSRSRSRSKSGSRSRSRSKSGSRSRSRSMSGSRSRSRSFSGSRSRSRSISGSRSRSRSIAGSRSRSRSLSRGRGKSGSRSRSRSSSFSSSRSRSGSRSSISPVKRRLLSDSESDVERLESKRRRKGPSELSDSDEGSISSKRKRSGSGSESDSRKEGYKKNRSRSASQERNIHGADDRKAENTASDSEDDAIRENLSRGIEQEFVNDFDQMMSKKKEENASRRRRKMNVDIINDNEEHIAVLVGRMRVAAEEDRLLNDEQKPAVKKIIMLNLVISQLQKCDLLEGFLDANVLSALTDWLAPMPDKSLPSVTIRQAVLNWLIALPVLNQDMLKVSGIGKAIMYLYKHPKEIKENKVKCGRLISAWSRPIFNNSDDFKTLSREERLNRDLELQRNSGQRKKEEPVPEDTSVVIRPGQAGWCYRARVPQPSTKDYVNRPKWLVDTDISKDHKKQPSRLQKQIRAFQDKKRQAQTKRAVKMSIEGRNMAL